MIPELQVRAQGCGTITSVYINESPTAYEISFKTGTVDMRNFMVELFYGDELIAKHCSFIPAAHICGSCYGVFIVLQKEKT